MKLNLFLPETSTYLQTLTDLNEHNNSDNTGENKQLPNTLVNIVSEKKKSHKYLLLNDQKQTSKL